MQAGMNPAQGPELHDIHLPPPPSWWPPAPGWWLLIALVVAASIFIFVFLYKKMQKRRRCRAVMAEFDRAVALHRSNALTLAATLSGFLRRLSLRDAPRSAALAGEAWLRHLDRRGATDEFTAGVGRALIEAPFRAQANYDVSALIALVRRTLRQSFDREATDA